MRILSLIYGLILIGSHLFAQPGSVKVFNASGIEVSNHASISEAYAAIIPPVSQAYTIELQNTYLGSSETVPLVFGAKAGASATNTITIRPAANFSSITLSATVSSGSLVELNDADFLILDGRPGGVGNTRAITLNNTATNGNTIGLINGATHNIIRYIQLQNSGTGSASRTLAVLTSASNPDGNSNNLFEFNVSSGSRYGFNSNGTAGNPNRNNVYFGNEIQSTIFSGIWIQAGTGRIILDSNVVYGTNTPATASNFGILFDGQTDTAIIRNNLVYDVITSNTTAIRGISIRSTSASGLDNYTEIYNNFIALSGPGSSSINIVGLEYAGANLVNAKIWFNTIHVAGSITSGGTSGNVLSAAFSKTASNAGSNYEIKNNLFLNSRSGGVAGGQHLAISLSNTVGTFTLDYNTYNSAGLLSRFGTATQNTVADFATALGGNNEANGNSTTVQLSSISDLTLTGTSLGNINLGGTPIAAVTADRFGTFRSNVPYRGAHEASPTLGGNQCQGTPDAGRLSQSDTLFCPSDGPIELRLTLAATGAGITYEWQTSADGINFTAIAGATQDSLLVSPIASSWYRVLTRCLASGQQAISDTVRIGRGNSPVLGALTFTIQGPTYTFTLNGSAQVDSFIWNFGDGTADVTTSVPNASHIYTGGGAFPVRVKAINICGIDSTQLNLSVTVSVKENILPNLRVYPNPFTDVLHIDGIESAFTVKFKDIHGREIRRYTAPAGLLQLSLVEMLPAVYLVEITDSQGRKSTQRLVKK